MKTVLSLFDAYLETTRGIAPLEPTERHLLTSFASFLGHDEATAKKKEEIVVEERVAAFLAASPSLERSLLPYERVLLVDYLRFWQTIQP